MQRVPALPIFCYMKFALVGLCLWGPQLMQKSLTWTPKIMVVGSEVVKTA